MQAIACVKTCCRTRPGLVCMCVCTLTCAHRLLCIVGMNGHRAEPLEVASPPPYSRHLASPSGSDRTACTACTTRGRYCGKRERELTMDHVVPLSRGGQDTWDNLVTAWYVREGLLARFAWHGVHRYSGKGAWRACRWQRALFLSHLHFIIEHADHFYPPPCRCFPCPTTAWRATSARARSCCHSSRAGSCAASPG